jgi:DNA-binding MarR family transcriptional regulator
MLPELLGYRLRRAQRAVYESFLRIVGEKEDITPGLFGMAQVIAANPGLNQTRLADGMGVDRSTIVTVIDKLESRGLVERRGSTRDPRAYCLHVTRSGRLAIRRMETLVRRHEEEVASGLTAAERETLMRLLARLYERERTTV